MKNEALRGYLKLVLILGIVAIYLFLYRNCFRIIGISGNSMADTVCDGGICFVDVGDVEVERYDIVLVELQYQTAIKRVVGLPNDRILIKDGVVYVNGMEVEKYNYFTEKGGIATNEILLGENEYFLLGDNRKISYDSREFGAVSETEIIGVVEKILFKGF